MFEILQGSSVNIRMENFRNFDLALTIHRRTFFLAISLVFFVQSGHFYCKVCAKFKHKRRYQVRVHIEAAHFRGTFAHHCKYCSEQFNCKKALENHRFSNHKHMKAIKFT